MAVFLEVSNVGSSSSTPSVANEPLYMPTTLKHRQKVQVSYTDMTLLFWDNPCTKVGQKNTRLKLIRGNSSLHWKGINQKLYVNLVYNAYVNCKAIGLVLRILQHFT